MTKPGSVGEAERQAEAARRELGATLDRLRDNLHPRHLAGEAVAATRARTPQWLVDAYGFATSASGLTLLSTAAASVGVTLMRKKLKRPGRAPR